MTKKGKWQWIKENQFFAILGVVIASIVLIFSICSYNLQKAEKKTPDLHLDVERPLVGHERIYLLLVNTGDAPANHVKVSIYMPPSIEDWKEGNWYCKAKFANAKKKGDTLVLIDYKERTIYPIYKNESEYSIAFIGDISLKGLKKSKKPLRYEIECKETDPVKKIISIDDIFMAK